eukprot:comp21459_c2_seq1/m.29666 comp21459_c2_seq1/g.29666  ORF comp21459_c2_seq1/g.29666 comp21459_c2_seq1/m.29666 type:complete len:517 (-) comp21459_c2_seq1:382-1932(-)
MLPKGVVICTAQRGASLSTSFFHHILARNSTNSPRYNRLLTIRCYSTQPPTQAGETGSHAPKTSNLTPGSSTQTQTPPPQHGSGSKVNTSASAAESARQLKEQVAKSLQDLTAITGTKLKHATANATTISGAKLDEALKNVADTAANLKEKGGNGGRDFLAAAQERVAAATERASKAAEASWKTIRESANAIANIRKDNKPTEEMLADLSRVVYQFTNKTTGYDTVLRLKENVNIADVAFHESRKAFKAAQTAYEGVLKQRSDCQQEVNRLLQRQASWQADDVSRFGELLKMEHELKRLELSAEEVVTKCEADVETKLGEYTTAMRERYHQEQIWSDKIRSLSTYGTLMVMGFNLFVLFLSIAAFEPRKRRKILEGVQHSLDEQRRETEQYVHEEVTMMGQHLEHKLTEGISILAQIPPPAPEPLPPPPPQPQEQSRVIGVDRETDEAAMLTVLQLLARERAQRAEQDRHIVTAAVAEAVTNLDAQRRREEMTVLAAIGLATGLFSSILIGWVMNR